MDIQHTSTQVTTLPDDSAMPVTSPQRGTQKQHKQKRTKQPSREGPMSKERPDRGIKSFFSACGASLLATGMSLPILASITTVALYLSPPLPFIPLLTSNWYAPAFGLLVALVIWLLIAVIFYRFATPEGANIRSYGLIESRLRQLKTRLGIIGPYAAHKEISTQEAEQNFEYMKAAIGFDPKKGADEATLRDAFTYGINLNEMSIREAEQNFEYMKAAIGFDPNEGASEVALRDAFTYGSNLTELLYSAHANLSWALGMGYINAWSLLHRAEEALIMVEPTEMVIGDAIHDLLSIQGSTIDNRDDLLKKLMQAVKDLDPSAMAYFSEHQPDKNYAQLMQVTKQHDNILNQLVQVSNKTNPLEPIDVHQGGEDTALSTPEDEAKKKSRARAALREVRHALNDFRDNSWEGIVRARTKLQGTTTLTGFVTHILLCITILIGLDVSQRPAIAAATIFYIVGAIAGMFGRFYKEAQSNTDVDDYGLSLARLIAIPPLSGLAGVGGVLITILLYSALVGMRDSTSLTKFSDIFRLDQPLYFIAAAVFGLTPNLIIKSLQEQAKKYVNDLTSSKSTTQADGVGQE